MTKKIKRRKPGIGHTKKYTLGILMLQINADHLTSQIAAMSVTVEKDNDITSKARSWPKLNLTCFFNFGIVLGHVHTIKCQGIDKLFIVKAENCTLILVLC